MIPVVLAGLSLVLGFLVPVVGLPLALAAVIVAKITGKSPDRAQQVFTFWAITLAIIINLTMLALSIPAFTIFSAENLITG